MCQMKSNLIQIITDGTNKVLVDYDHNRKDKPKEADISNIYKITK